MLKNSKDKSLAPYGYGSACSFYLGAIIVLLVCQAVAAVVSASISKTFGDVSKNGDFNTAFMIVIQLANAAFIYFYTRMKKRRFDFTIVHDAAGKPLTPSAVIVPIIAAALLMVGMYLPTIWYGYFTRAIGLPPDYGEVQITTPSAVVMMVIAAVFLAPCFEETIYRGVLLDGMRREKTEVKAVLLTALAFMLQHMNPVQVVFQFALGVLAAYTVVKSGRLICSVILHATANALALVIQFTALGEALNGCVAWLTNNIAAAFFITLGLFAACGAGLFVLIKYGFDIKRAAAKIVGKHRAETEPRKADGAAEAAQNAGADAQSEKTEVDGAIAAAKLRSELARKDGTFKYWIGIGICALMLIINLISGIMS